jgi:hypothetical protein
LVGACADFFWQCAIVVLKVRVCAVDHLERLRSCSLAIGFGAADPVVQLACFEVSFELRIDGRTTPCQSRLG